MTIRAVIVEDHALTRTGLHTALSAAGIHVVGEAADGITALDTMHEHEPDVAVVDIGLPGRDGIELTQLIRKQLPDTHVVIVTMIDLEQEVVAALAAGADAYCVKTAPPERMIEAVRIAAEGGAYFDPAIAHVVLRRFAPNVAEATASPLTPRESAILERIAAGVSNAEIAKDLGIGLGTVKGHVRSILEKLSAADRTQAAVVALRRGYI
ncbi:MAG: response regulator transcription factor [Candidatus Eremiobacteraeota bacterium]|nr:response regulator transcription factor [Candidatus Eremiobacteraeota bacterium]